ncbi:alpha/beta hydrolase [Pseudomonadota bacterium]
MQNYAKSEIGERFCLATPTGERIFTFQHDAGSEKVGVFAHGFRSNCLGEKSQAFMEHAIKRGYSWISFDMRGHGNSDGLFENFTLTNALQDLDCILDSVEDREILLVGSSLGGWLSLLTAQERPRQIVAMMLIAPAINFVQNYFSSLPQQQLDTWAETDGRKFTDLYDGSAYSLTYQIIEDASSYENSTPKPPLQCPVKIIHGDHDEVISLDISHQLIQDYSIEHSALCVIKGGDHRLNKFIPEMCDQIDTLWQPMKRD